MSIDVMIEPDERGRVSLSKNSGNNAARFLNAAMVMCEDLGNRVVSAWRRR